MIIHKINENLLRYISIKLYIYFPLGGPDGELGASMRYLSQRYSQPFNEVKGILTDIGIEEIFCALRKESA